ncbi:hypothetical protein J5A68_09755 [Prevotella melaninogenica]|uniref:dCTP deaminase domain-containing protein n=1 Tax=Prevotella melaninogenica TaxID=28132 RepID=UPI001BA48AA4|nr:hypothetical protein [Prevotella melaninogenica]QUB69689.1 hypothetical protein J5A68_09755 [Prevotella melaninogenica]
MFSKIDIQKSLGKDIIFFPFKEENIKENSLNLTVSKWAWTLTEVPQDELAKVGNNGEKKYGEKKSCLINKDGNDYIILFPFSTTMVITNEFLAIGKSIGGTIHTRVGTAALGVGHISTMLGPSYMGRLCVPLHNPTCKPIYLPVGDSFLSIIFYRLNSSIKESNHTSKAHIDKFSTWEITLNEKERQEICLEDLKDMETCVEEMNNCESFLQYKKKHSLKNRIWDIVKDWFSARNIIIFVLLFVAIILLIMLLQYPESTSTKRIEDVIIVFIVSLLLRLIPSEK